MLRISGTLLQSGVVVLAIRQLSRSAARLLDSAIYVADSRRTILYIPVERRPKLHVQESGGYQLKMPPLAAIGAPQPNIAKESGSDGSAARVEGWIRQFARTDRQAAS